MRLAVFASGGGSNFQAILDAVAGGRLPADVVLCVSNREGAGVLVRARDAGVPTAVVNPSAFSEEAAYAEALQARLRTHGVTFIALAGYLKRIPSAVVQAYKGRMLNIHPALLPAFGGHGMYGRRVHEAALAYGVRWTGVTVHLVDEDYDTGPIVLQQPVPVLADDTPDVLAGRVLAEEHRLYPEALRLFAEGRVTLDGRLVRLQPSTRIADPRLPTPHPP